jgi:hypothetical protein
VVAAGPGVLVTYADAGADVWRLQEGKVRRWQSFADADRARAAALAIEAYRSIPVDAKRRDSNGGEELGASKPAG